MITHAVDSETVRMAVLYGLTNPRSHSRACRIAATHGPNLTPKVRDQLLAELKLVLERTLWPLSDKQAGEVFEAVAAIEAGA